PIRPAFHSPPLLFFRRPQPSTLSPYTTLCRSPGVTMTVTDTELTDGRIVAIAGPVVDVEFPSDSVPEINQALEFTITVDGVDTVVVAEVAQQIGDNRVRAIAMKPTDGLVRGTAVRNLGHGISLPAGDATLGHVFNVLRQRLD